MSTTAGVREEPIPMVGPMVRAILAGRKTQDRRVVKPQPEHVYGRWGTPDHGGLILGIVEQDQDGEVVAEGEHLHCPHGAPGDRLWVRESCWLRPERTPTMMREGADTWPRVIYSADGEDDWCREHDWARRPSTHMPRWASRITLEITGIRVERLQAITEEDARAEGAREAIHDLDGRAWDRATSDWCRLSRQIDPDARVANDRGAFAAIWDRINGKAHPWSSNCWVWAITFRRIEVTP